jgi:hypothetical protein
VLRAAHTAAEWAAGAPLLLGGDLNLRPWLSGAAFRVLEREIGLRAPTGERVIDHLLIAGGEIVEPARQWPPQERETPEPDPPPGPALAVRLSDHAPVEAVFRIPEPPAAGAA